MKADKQTKVLIKLLAIRHDTIKCCRDSFFNKTGGGNVRKNYFWQLYESQISMRLLIASLGREHLVNAY